MLLTQCCTTSRREKNSNMQDTRILRLIYLICQSLPTLWRWSTKKKHDVTFRWHNWHWYFINDNRSVGMWPYELGPPWKHGRLRVYYDKSNKATSPGISLSWKVPYKSWGMRVSIGGSEGETLKLHLGLGIVSWWLTVENLISRRPRNRWLNKLWQWVGFEGRQWGISTHEWVIMWEWATDPWHDHGVGKSGIISIRDKLRGKYYFRRHKISEQRVQIPLPEGVIPGTVTFSLFEWKWKRWPFVSRVISAEITPDTPAVIPGKGDNGWDMSDDAVFSLSLPAETPEKAVAAYIESVLHSRRTRPV
jgi:hypothetical protein